ncbi:peptidase M13 [Paenarthrobacter sp. DKR-5]|uniref:M13 family metallopeptidase n=1 Tax=Paenarthrobacter sp. DKR-5 TaxID=2835535 RepID=UPI001BDCD0AA|nr:M13-type metalloendopeptidase [Paenarthrobacter sp. DKR-5]MBT1001721.1 peptidase M13 [Paenarthrobacter sp. DKR-5]
MTRSGIILANIDPEVRPQDDLYAHVNGTWLRSAVIPDDRPLEGSFTELRDGAELAVRSIIEDAAGHEGDDGGLRAKIGDLYASFMDEEAIERRGDAPLQERLARVAAVADREAFISLLGEFDRSGVSGLIDYSVNSDAGDPTRSLLYLYQGGLGLPDESYYREEKFASIRTAYVEHITRMLSLAGLPGAAESAEAVMGLETALAKHHWDNVTLRDPQKTYNLKDAAAAAALMPQLPRWFEGVGIPEDKRTELVIGTPDFFSGAATLLESEDLATWRSWLAFRLIRSAAPYLPAAYVAGNFAFYGTTLSGTPSNRERWKRGVSLVEGALGEAVGQLYVEKHFPPSHKARMEALVGNLIEAYRESISSLTWMSAETIAKALEKLEKFRPKIGYPVKWIDYSTLQVDRSDLLGNVERSHVFELNRQLDKIGEPVDRDEWFMTPQTVNAYYHPLLNEIVFPAAILQPPFFDAEADDAVNYGGIGAVIGHEIGHGFDDQGSQFDGDGALRNWWTDEDRKAFEALTAKLVEQYNALSPAIAPGHHVNGALTLGENIGDLGGLTIAHRAYVISLDGKEPETLDGLTGFQRFFFSWAQGWRQKIRQEEAIRRLAVDPHSPNEFRTNAIVKNMSEFHEAFGVTDRDGLWLDPADRVRIW